MPIPFAKVESIGNDFVLIDGLEMPEMDWSSLALRMCERHFGVGSDGLLVITTSNVADFRFRMWNPDGTEDVCGNGMRCGAVYASEKHLVPGRSMSMEAKSGIVYAEIVESDGKACARVNMGDPSIRPEDIPLAEGVLQTQDLPVEIGEQSYLANCVTVGTPHAVIFAERGYFWDRIPPMSESIEKHPLFPERINVTWCHVESPESLVVRTWERGVGPTLGCGSGACCALVAANLHGLAESSASVRSPGGALQIDWPEQGDVLASGSARVVFEGEWPNTDNRQMITDD